MGDAEEGEEQRMNKVVNIRANEVFQTLATGASVYSISPDTDDCTNLKYEVVELVNNVVKSGRSGFFIVEQEEE